MKSMWNFILKRIALAVPTVIAVSLVVFFAARLAPSDPVLIILGDKATPESVAALRHSYGLDKPLLVQYTNYVSGVLLRGDFGKSFARRDTTVTEMIRQDFPVTATLALSALLFAMAVGLPIGALAALYHNSWFDRAAMAVVVALVSVPSIVLGPLLVLVVAIKFGWLPVSGWEFTHYQIQMVGYEITLTLPQLSYLILPTVTLGSRSAALVARFMRSSLLDTLRQDYLRTALAKGLSKGRAVRRHALKNAFLPVLTVLGTNFGALLTGSFVVETLFQVPGIGFASIDSITRRDYPVIQGMALLVALIFISVNLLVDILYGVIDPRVRSQEAHA